MNKESREKLLIEIMQADEADGLYNLPYPASADDSLFHVHVVFNINGDIIGIATNRERAIEINEERYGWLRYPDDADMNTFDRFAYLHHIHAISTYPLNYFIYA